MEKTTTTLKNENYIKHFIFDESMKYLNENYQSCVAGEEELDFIEEIVQKESFYTIFTSGKLFLMFTVFIFIFKMTDIAMLLMDNII